MSIICLVSACGSVNGGRQFSHIVWAIFFSDPNLYRMAPYGVSVWGQCIGSVYGVRV